MKNETVDQSSLNPIEEAILEGIENSYDMESIEISIQREKAKLELKDILQLGA